jgi:hypothetical protein
MLAIAVGGAVLMLSISIAIRGHESAEQRTLALTLLAALLLSPVVWAHYFVFLLIPVAIAHRRLSAAWFALWGLWLAGGTWTQPSTLQIGASLTVMALATLGAMKAARELPAILA